MIERTGRTIRAPCTVEDERILKRCPKVMLAGDRYDADYIYCRVDAAFLTGERFCRLKFRVTPERCVPCSMFDQCKHK